MLAQALAAPSAPRQVAEGRSIAIDGCSACRQVTPDQKPSAPVSNPDELTLVFAPTFAEIAKNHGTDEVYLRAAITTPQHPMREQRFLESDLNAIIAYIRSLQTGPAPRKP